MTHTTPRRIGDLVRLTSGQSPSGFRFGVSGRPYFKVDQLGKSTKYLTIAETPYISEDVPVVQPGSVLIAKRGGAIALNHVRILSEPGFMDTNVMALTPTGELTTEYLFYWLSYRGLWDIADVTSVPQINNKHINPLEINLPTTAEQDAIARVLADADALILGLKRQIAKKRDVKQAMMQELLTGRTRLPGFTGAWTTLRVANVSHLKARIGWQGLTTEEYRTSGTYRLVGGTDFADGRVNWNTTPYVDKWRYDQDPNIQLRVGDVLITKDGTVGKVALVDCLPGPTTLNSGVFVLRPKPGAYDSTFLFCMLRSRAFEEFVAGLSAGSTISHLYQKDLVTLEFRVPASIAEQAALANALLDADAELAALGRRLRSARNIKQGMMQELLTGGIRLATEGMA